MPMAFDLYTAKRADLLPQVNAIAQGYFTLDTATSDIAATWYKKNPYVLIVAAKDDIVYGYADFLPLTDNALTLIKERRLKEEEIGPEHILAPAELDQCRAVYFAGIAVRDRKTVLGMRCAAALIAGMAHMLEHVYRSAPLEFFLANPTTFSGNRLTLRMGLEPVSHQKKTTSGMDLYMLPYTPQEKIHLQALYNAYGSLIDRIPWKSQKS
jgi:hypothetical protein